mgnify:CR=1 FL=1
MKLAHASYLLQGHFEVATLEVSTNPRHRVVLVCDLAMLLESLDKVVSVVPAELNGLLIGGVEAEIGHICKKGDMT